MHTHKIDFKSLFHITIAAAVRLSYDRYFEIIDWFRRTSAGSPYEIVKPYDSCKVTDQLLDMSTFVTKFARFQKPNDDRNATARQTHEYLTKSLLDILVGPVNQMLPCKVHEIKLSGVHTALPPPEHILYLTKCF